MPHLASASARWGPTPFRYMTSVVGVRRITSLYHPTPRGPRLAIAFGMRKDGSLLPARLEARLTGERLDASDKKVLLIWILVGLLGAGLAYKFFFRAVPEASVEFQVPCTVALELARQFAVSQGARLDGYQSS